MPLKYTPSGVPIVEFTLAVSQKAFDKSNMGYYEIIAEGPAAETAADTLRIGKEITVTGRLWNRNFRNRQGTKMNDTRIILETLGGNA